MVQLELRRLSKELQEALESKNKLFHILSHDLRSPFNGILAFSRTLVDERDTLTKDEIQDFSQTVLTSAEQFMHLIDNLLQSTRFELGVLEYQPVNMAIDTVVDNVLALLKGNATQKMVDLIYESHPEAEVFADATMLHSIFQNLIGNAIKFTPVEGRVKVQVVDQGAMIQVSVIDTGVGVSPKKLAGLFEVMAGRSTDGTAGEKGTGLGLLLCKDLVEKHGGWLWVDSVVGQGTSFHLTLPKAQSTVSA